MFLLVAVLSFSLRLFVRIILNQHRDDWRDGVSAAFVHFGGVPLEVLGNKARPLVDEQDRQAGTVRFHPAWVEFCRDWDVTPKACGPYRAHQGQDGVRRQVRQAQRTGEQGLRVLHRDGEAPGEVDGRGGCARARHHVRAPHRQVRARAEGRAAPAAIASTAAPTAEAPSASWPTPRWWTWTRCATARRTGWCATASKCRWEPPRCASSTRASWWPRTHVARSRTGASSTRRTGEGLWRARAVEPTADGSKLAVLERSLEDYAAMVEQGAKRGTA
jgi:hypothetical protein